MVVVRPATGHDQMMMAGARLMLQAPDKSSQGQNGPSKTDPCLLAELSDAVGEKVVRRTGRCC